MKCVIGIVGENGAGKATFTTFFRAAAAPQKVAELRFSNVLTKTLDLWGIDLTRPNLQNLAIIMDGQYGKGSLTRATEAEIKRAQDDFVIVEGVRWKTDVPMIKSFEKSALIYVTADPKIRFKRMKARGEKKNEAKMTYEEFLIEEKAATETQIPEIGKQADFKIENNTDLESFRSEVEKIYDQLKS
ncbi:MAG TPA: hypothetical protein VG965_03560 [Patescibacteria group bacterium]|nr:hypothetical protein [Patescibacteria group bacterium]